jgi:hypothetical protein
MMESAPEFPQLLRAAMLDQPQECSLTQPATFRYPPFTFPYCLTNQLIFLSIIIIPNRLKQFENTPDRTAHPSFPAVNTA